MFLEKVFRLVLRLTPYFILSLLFIITNVVVSSANDNKGKYYQSLSKDWRSIFPDGNRNAAGPKFYKHISDKYKNFSEFKEYNKHYCAVSGSLIAENSIPQFINIKEHITEKEVCGYYYKCCWPCVCDLMKYAKVKKITRKFKSQVKQSVMLIGLEETANMLNTSTEIVVQILLKRFRNDGPYITKAAVRKTRSTVRKMEQVNMLTKEIAKLAGSSTTRKRATTGTRASTSRKTTVIQ